MLITEYMIDIIDSKNNQILSDGFKSGFANNVQIVHPIIMSNAMYFIV